MAMQYEYNVHGYSKNSQFDRLSADPRFRGRQEALNKVIRNGDKGLRKASILYAIRLQESDVGRGIQ